MDRQDETLQGNEKIEVAIQALQKEATQEQLAHTLTVIRRRMKDSGQVIVAVEPSIGTPYFHQHQHEYLPCVLHL